MREKDLRKLDRLIDFMPAEAGMIVIKVSYYYQMVRLEFDFVARFAPFS